MNSSFHHRKMENSNSPSKNGKEHFTISDTEPPKRPTGFLEEMERGKYQMTRTQTYHYQIFHQRKINAIKLKSDINTGKMNHQTHHQATNLIRPMNVITDASDVRRKEIGKSI